MNQQPGRPPRQVSPSATFHAKSHSRAETFSIPQEALDTISANEGDNCHFWVKWDSGEFDGIMTIRSGRIVYDAKGLPSNTNIKVVITKH